MNYKIGNNVVENKIFTYYPVLVVKFNEYKCVYFIKRDLMYFAHNYFFSQTYDADNILCANTFVKAVKSYLSPSNYLEHYFSVIRKEHVITTSLMDNKYHTSPENF